MSSCPLRKPRRQLTGDGEKGRRSPARGWVALPGTPTGENWVLEPPPEVPGALHPQEKNVFGGSTEAASLGVLEITSCGK